MLPRWFWTASLLCLALATCARAQEKGSSGSKSPPPKESALKPMELTLEKIFPKRGLFGPTARAMSFSYDGKYAAYLYQTQKERTQGADLWILEVATGKVTQATSMARMARYQASARKALEAAQNREREKGKEQKGEQKQEKTPSPRYSGLSSFTWSPTAHELLFLSEGDIYRLKVGEEAPTRLTKTRSPESNVEYLPDGRGYTYQRDNALLRAVFGSDLTEQLDPTLPADETLGSYRISPDGKRMVFTSRKGKGPFTGERKVNIASYRDRFMKVQEVARQVSDDPLPSTEMTVYLHEFGEPMIENGPLMPIFRYKYSGPRDVLSLPEWSPDSRKVVFSIYQQTTGQIQVLTAQAAPEPKPGAKRETVKPAQVVYRFLHTGGPNTPPMTHPRFLADNCRVVLLTEVSGFRHLHILDPLDESLEQVTRGRFEVYPIALSKDRQHYYVTATREDPSCLDVYRVSLAEAKLERVTTEKGCYEQVAVSPDGSRFLAIYSRFGSPQELVQVEVGKGPQKELTSSHSLTTRQLTTVRPEFFTYKNRHGHDIHGFLFKPNDWTRSDKRPLLIYVYGGPLGTRKQVVEGSYQADSYFFARYMAERHGYVTVTIDPRGMSGYGSVFEKSNFQQVGRPQVEDLVDGVKFLVANYGVDPKKVGIHGWSFGGFQTQMCMYTEPNVFAVGMAGAGPTEWENYNAWYSTGTIDSSRPGQPDLSKYSLLPLAKNLKGKLLLVHGMEDSNVLYQDTVRVYRELLKAGKETQVELFLDPTGGHGLGGDVDRLARARKYEDFLLRYLGKGAPASPMSTTSARDVPTSR